MAPRCASPPRGGGSRCSGPPLVPWKQWTQPISSPTAIVPWMGSTARHLAVVGTPLTSAAAAGSWRQAASADGGWLAHGGAAGRLKKLLSMGGGGREVFAVVPSLALDIRTMLHGTWGESESILVLDVSKAQEASQRPIATKLW